MNDEHLPGFYHDADEASRAGQRATLLLSRIRLIGAVVAAVGGAFKWRIGGGVDVWAWVALAGFLVALFGEFLLWFMHPELKWNAGRAVAERVKSLAWRYAVGGDPLPATTPNPRRALDSAISSVAAQHRGTLLLTSANPAGDQMMTEVRARPFTERREIYRENRVWQQLDWYRGKAAANERRATTARILLFAGEFIAILFAVLRIVGAWDVDLSGVMAAAVAGGAAWIGLRQWENLKVAYSTAANELADIHQRLPSVDEEEWPAFVAEVEAVISNEHTAWLASRPGTA
ncbi:DUF4231 domain-containing protein [Lentzea jiangxiensis]|uniref:SMODS and SLOG-associating 2TM effector domain-containing protein n=1 Tax=Lentzea jiangxiensis TaxID=641025 RepID=A0A1H0QAU7_9PSEU|nr:DUF4231 domain-containing protein [Lentzea jiangxiensis]SDP14467.1 Protein of unknown function [Lentzea jiangxiensis]